MKHENIIYVIAFTAMVAMLFCVFLLLYIVLRQLVPEEIIFYSGLKTVLYALLLSMTGGGILYAFLRGRFPALESCVNTRLVFPAVVAYLLLGYSFIITIPSLLDRSISIFVIATVAQAGPAGVGLDAIQRRFLAGYINGTSTVEKRLQEQLASKNMTMDNGTYRITERGKAVYATNVLLARLFNIDDRYVQARTTDAQSRAH